MAKLHLRQVFLAAGISILAGVLVLGVNQVFGLDAPTTDPALAGLVSPTFNGLDVRGNLKNGSSVSTPVTISGDLKTTGNTSLTGTLGVTGATTMVNAVIGGTLGVTGATTLGNTTNSGFLTLGVDQWLTVDKITSSAPGVLKAIQINTPLQGGDDEVMSVNGRLDLKTTATSEGLVYADSGVWSKGFLTADGDFTLSNGTIYTTAGNLTLKDPSSNANSLQITNGDTLTTTSLVGPNKLQIGNSLKKETMSIYGDLNLLDGYDCVPGVDAKICMATKAYKANLNVAGIVGIGTTNPKTQLHLDNTSNLGPQITLSAPTGGTPGIIFRPYQTPAQWTNPAQATITAKDNNWSADINFKTKIPGALGNALQESMTIHNDGHVTSAKGFGTIRRHDSVGKSISAGATGSNTVTCDTTTFPQEKLLSCGADQTGWGYISSIKPDYINSKCTASIKNTDGASRILTVYAMCFDSAQ